MIIEEHHEIMEGKLRWSHYMKQADFRLTDMNGTSG